MTNAKDVLEWIAWKEKREREMTNDEWRKTCSAEEFAEFLCNVGFENETIVRKFRSEWVKWLKEKHDGSM